MRRHRHGATEVAPYIFGVCIIAASVMAQTTFTTVAKGDMSRQQMMRHAIVRDAAAWKALWKDHAPAEKLPPIEFDSRMVVGIFLGTKPSVGYDVEIVAVRAEGKDLIVEYEQKMPGRGTMTAQILTEPYHLVSVPRHEGEVRFVEVVR